MKNDLTTGTWQDNIWCPINIILLCTSDDHSSEGLAKEGVDDKEECGQEAIGTSPIAKVGDIDGSKCNTGQLDNFLTWLHKINYYWTYDKAELLSALINQIFPCITCNNHRNIDNLTTWVPVFLCKSGNTTWEILK
jgi:hypothetical protein